MVVGFGGWTSHVTTQNEISRWSKDSRFGICLQTRHVRAVDVDVGDFNEAIDIEDYIDAQLGMKLPCRRRPNSTKFLMVFRLDGDYTKRKFKTHTEGSAIEFLATGQQFIAIGTHTSGVRYEWDGGLPDSIPTLTVEQFEALWKGLEEKFASEESVTVRAGQKPLIKRRIEDIDDPMATFLEEEWEVFDVSNSGRIDIRCPFEEGHSPGSNPTSTSYYPAGVGGFQKGHFKCLHASCAHRTDQDFIDAVGFMLRGFEVIEVEPLEGEYLPAGDKPRDGPLQAFYAYLPEHKYIHRPTRALWPMASVNGSLEGVSIGKDKPAAWLDKHRAIHQMTWAPGMPEVVVDKIMADGAWINHPGQSVYNLYRPPVVVHGNAQDVAPWRKHLRTIYPVESEAAHIEKWLAHRVQFPGVKINHALVLGGSQGIGKDTLLEPVKRAIGAWNWGDINPQNLLSQFNPYVKSVVLRVNETHDLGDQTRFELYERCKTLTAAPPDVLDCNEKNTRQYAVVNIMGVIFTTNHKTDGIYLPPDDRRHFVAWSNKAKEDFTDEYWQSLWRWLDAEGSANVAEFLRTLDLSDFNAKARPPRTEAFYAIVAANNNPRDVALSSTIADEMGGPDVLTLDDILAVIDPDGLDDNEVREFLSSRNSRRKIPHAMDQAGYVPVRNEGADDGLWKVCNKRKTIYGRRDLSFAELTKAAQSRAKATNDEFIKNCKQVAAAKREREAKR